MTRRTKLWICVGVLLVGAGVMRTFTKKPQVEVSLVGYSSNGAPVLSFTNKGQRIVSFPSMDVWPSSEVPLHNIPRFFLPVVLEPRSSTQLVVWPISVLELVSGSSTQLVAWSPSETSWPIKKGTAFVQCVTPPSGVIEELLSEVGIKFANTFVVSVTLPPREGAASLSNTPPAKLPR